MKRLLTIAILLWASSALAQPVNEWTIERPTYTIKGNGIAYNDGTWKESDAIIDYSNPTKWENLEVTTPWNINTSNLTLTIARGSQASTIQPDGIYWLNTTSWAVTEAVGWAVPVVTENPTSVFLDGILDAGDGDAELVSKKSGVSWDYVFNDTTGWTANPYPVGESALIVRYQLGRNHTVTADGAPVDWGGTVASTVTFEAAGEKFDLASVSATDGAGVEYPITYYLRTAQGKDWFMEGIPAADFSAATLPLRYHYTTESGVIAVTDTWSGDIYLDGGATIAGATITVDAGTKIAMSNNGANKASLGISDNVPNSILDVNGTAASPVIMSSCLDVTYLGFDATSESECVGVADSPVAGDWDALFFSVTSPGNTGSHSYLDYFEVAYAGFAGGGVIRMGGTSTSYINGMYLHDSCPAGESATGDAILEQKSDAEDANKIYYYTITNSIIVQEESCPISHNEITLTNRTYYGDYRNNLIITDAPSGLVWHERAANDAGQHFTFQNNTLICTGAANTATAYSFLVWRAPAVPHINNNFVTGCGIGFIGLLDPTADQSHNKAWNNTTDYSSWTPGTGSDSDDPSLSTSHDHSATWPISQDSTLDNYHFSTSSDMIDTGSDTAANLGLDSDHVTDDGVADSGTVDRGFHYASIGGGSRPDPPTGANPPNWGSQGKFGSGRDGRWGWGLTNWGDLTGRW